MLTALCAEVGRQLYPDTYTHWLGLLFKPFRVEGRASLIHCSGSCIRMHLPLGSKYLQLCIPTLQPAGQLGFLFVTAVAERSENKGDILCLELRAFPVFLMIQMEVGTHGRARLHVLRMSSMKSVAKWEKPS